MVDFVLIVTGVFCSLLSTCAYMSICICMYIYTSFHIRKERKIQTSAYVESATSCIAKMYLGSVLQYALIQDSFWQFPVILVVRRCWYYLADCGISVPLLETLMNVVFMVHLRNSAVVSSSCKVPQISFLENHENSPERCGV